MKKLPSMALSLVALIAAAPPCLAHESVADASEEASRETVKEEFRYGIPTMPGKVVTSLSVEYPPGASTPPHRHGDAFVIGYVLEGSIRSQVDGEMTVYGVGESWTERPGASHEVSENASDRLPAKVMAIFISDAEQQALVEMPE